MSHSHKKQQQPAHDAPPAAAAAAVQPKCDALDAKTVLVPLVSGLCFGAVFQLSRVHESYFIRSQMLMRHFLMLKMFLSAAGTSVLVMHLLPVLSPKVGRDRVQAKIRAATTGIAETRGVPTLAAGAALIGVGMAITGSCPGTVFAQIAAGSRQAWWIVLGGVLAGGFQPLLDLIPGWKSLVKSGGRRFQAWTLPQVLGGATATKPLVVALAVAGMFASIVAALEWVAPWQVELALLEGGKSSVVGSAGAFAIPPWIAGMVVGGLQLPLIMLVNSQLGCSGSYVTLASNIVAALGGSGLTDRVPSFCAQKGSYFQVLLMSGVILGSFLTSSLGAAVYKSEGVITAQEGVIGGFLMVLGARVAGGCTSGHGISGMGYLALNSFVAVASMFGAGIITSFMFYR